MNEKELTPLEQLAHIRNALTELNEYKQLEEELEIDLAKEGRIYLKSMDNGVYAIDKDTKEIFFVEPRDLSLDLKNHRIIIHWEGRAKSINDEDIYGYLPIKHYGKNKFNAWALTKEELL